MADGVVKVGAVIANAIREQANGSFGTLFFLCLITKLCKIAGVSIVKETHIKPAPPIDVAKMTRYYVEDGAAMPQQATMQQRGLLSIIWQVDQIERTRQHMVQSLYGLESMIQKFTKLHHFDPDSLGGLPASLADEDDEGKEELLVTTRFDAWSLKLLCCFILDTLSLFMVS